MRKRMLTCVLAVCLALLCLIGCAKTTQPSVTPPPGETDNRVVVSGSKTIFYGDDNGEKLTNPLMGWSYYAFPEEIIRYGIPDEFDVGIIKCSWDKIETERGVFDFSELTSAINRLRTDGKMVYLRLYLMPDDVWDVAGYPAWVKSVAGIDPDRFVARRIHIGSDREYAFEHPDYENATYLQLMSDFLERLAAEYPDGTVDAIDVRNYGLYGEWDSGWGNYFEPYANETDDRYTRVLYGPEDKPRILGKLVQVFADAFASFERTQIAINVPSATFDSDEEKEAYFYECAYDVAMDAGFAIRFDAVENSYSDRFFLKWLLDKYPDAPVFSETVGWTGDNPGFEAKHKMACDFVHSNTTTFGFYTGNWEYPFYNMNYDFYTESMRPSERFDNLVQGYRLIPEEISFNKEANVNGKIHFSSRWKNVGSGKLYLKYPLALSLIDAAGEEVYFAVREDFDITHTGMQAEYAYSTAFNLPTADVLPAGTYTVRIALVDPYDNNRSAIALPIGENANENRDYEIGRITLK